MKLDFYNTAFTSIAPYYDRLMSFVNYPAWVEYIEKILFLNNIKQKKILDLACGTGVCLELWCQKNYEVIGLDRSLPMLKVCKQRLSQNNGVLLLNCDMRDFALKIDMPIITCLYDSLNYLLKHGDLLNCFNQIYDALSDGGIFIFDMNTIHSLRDEWGNNSFNRQDEELFSVWRNTFDMQTNISSLRLTIHVRRNGEELILREYHQERGYPLSMIKDLLGEAGFKFSLYRHLTFVPAEESNMRIMGVARKC